MPLELGREMMVAVHEALHSLGIVVDEDRPVHRDSLHVCIQNAVHEMSVTSNFCWDVALCEGNA